MVAIEQLCYSSILMTQSATSTMMNCKGTGLLDFIGLAAGLEFCGVPADHPGQGSTAIELSCRLGA
jgi:hypothetical protein